MRESNFIQMAGRAGNAAAYTLSIVCSEILVSCLGEILIFDGTPQTIIQQCQIAALRWPNVVSSAAANAIFKIRALNIECSFSCVALSAVLLLPKSFSSIFIYKNTFNMAR